MIALFATSLLSLASAQDAPPAEHLEITQRGTGSVSSEAATGELFLTGLVAPDYDWDGFVQTLTERSGVVQIDQYGPGQTIVYGEFFGTSRSGDASEPGPRFVNARFGGAAGQVRAALELAETDGPPQISARVAYRPASKETADTNAVRAAVSDAEAKARRLAASLGCTLTQVESISVLNTFDGDTSTGLEPVPGGASEAVVSSAAGVGSRATAVTSASIEVRFSADCVRSDR